MKRELMLVRYSYVPNNAPINRFLAFAKGYGENGIKTTVIFLRPDKFRSKVEYSLDNVEFKYLWEHSITENKYLNFLCALIKLFMLLKSNIPVIFYGVREYLFLFRLKPRIKMFYEMTEHPSLFYNFDKLTEKLKYKLYLNICKKLDGIFVISPSLYNFYTREVHVNKEKVHIANMVVDETRFKGLDNNPDSLYISYCGTVSMYKDGVDVLLKSFSQIHKYHPELKLRIIGPFMSQKDETELRYLSNSLDLNEHIDFTGKISASQMPAILSNSKILVLSRPDNKQAKYGFPTKLGEYLLTGVPVLVTRVGDIDKYLSDKENVFFAKPNSVDDFTSSLEWILNNYKESLIISSKGKNVALNHFNYLIESKKNIDSIFN